MQIIKGKKQRPRRTLLYGTPGIGKSTWASKWPNTFFVDVEGGIGDIDCHSCEDKIESWEDFKEQLRWLYKEDHDYKHIVIDTLSKLEKLIWARVALDKGVSNIEEIKFKAGYNYAVKYWDELVSMLDAIRDQRDIHVTLIAHAKIERFENPEGDAYDRYLPSINRLAIATLYTWADEVLFATFPVHIRKVEGKLSGTQVAKGIGTGQRVIKTTARPSHLAKNRLGMPDEIGFEWSEYESFLKGTKNV